ncbi:MAG: hypothetical protein U0903_01935 [Planctomycetales bacterium]
MKVSFDWSCEAYWLKQLAQTEIQLVPGVGLIQGKILVTGQ